MVTSLSTTLHCFKIIDQVVPFARTLNKVLGLMWVFHENDLMIDFFFKLHYDMDMSSKLRPCVGIRCIVFSAR